MVQYLKRCVGNLTGNLLDGNINNNRALCELNLTRKFILNIETIIGKKVLTCVYGNMMRMRYYKKSRMNVKRDFRKLENQYIEDHSYHTEKYKKFEMDLPDDGGLDELLQIVKMEKFCLDITSKNVMSDVYFRTLDEEKKNSILQEFRMMSFKYSELYSKYDSVYLKKVLSTYVNVKE